MPSQGAVDALIFPIRTFLSGCCLTIN